MEGVYFVLLEYLCPVCGLITLFAAWGRVPRLLTTMTQ